MRASIFCLPTAKGVHSIYLATGGATHFLFSQNYRRGVQEYFRSGVCLDDAMDFSRARGNSALIHTMEKLLSHIRYVEREYGITVLRKTEQKNAKRRKRVAFPTFRI